MKGKKNLKKGRKPEYKTSQEDKEEEQSDFSTAESDDGGNNKSSATKAANFTVSSISSSNSSSSSDEDDLSLVRKSYLSVKKNLKLKDQNMKKDMTDGGGSSDSDLPLIEKFASNKNNSPVEKNDAESDSDSDSPLKKTKKTKEASSVGKVNESNIDNVKNNDKNANTSNKESMPLTSTTEVGHQKSKVTKKPLNTNGISKESESNQPSTIKTNNASSKDDEGPKLDDQGEIAMKPLSDTLPNPGKRKKSSSVSGCSSGGDSSSGRSSSSLLEGDKENIEGDVKKKKKPAKKKKRLAKEEDEDLIDAQNGKKPQVSF